MINTEFKSIKEIKTKLSTPKTISSAVFKVVDKETSLLFGIDGNALGRQLLKAGPQIFRHVVSGLVALCNIFAQRTVNNARKGFRQLGIHLANSRMRFIGNLVHELSHRFADEGQLAARHLIERNTQREDIRSTVDFLA